MGNQKKESNEKVYISNKKEISKYLTACFYALGNERNEVHIIGRGNNVKRSIDIAAILLRQYLDVPSEFPTLSDVLKALDEKDTQTAIKLIKRLMACEIRIGSEQFENRHVSTIDIILRGKKRKNEKSVQ